LTQPQARIEGAGGCVLHYQGTLRVMGVLACTRAIGDHDLDGYGVTAEPEVLTWERHPGDECLILASDGLWDKVGSQVGCQSRGRMSAISFLPVPKHSDCVVLYVTYAALLAWNPVHHHEPNQVGTTCNLHKHTPAGSCGGGASREGALLRPP
jgi:hypothetical protein